MTETYKMLKQTITKNFSQFTNEELTAKYQQEADEQIYAELFCRNVGVLSNIAASFSNVDSLDAESYATESVFNAIINFQPERNIKFSTVLRTYFIQKLCGVLQKDKQLKLGSLAYLDESTNCDDNACTLLDLIPDNNSEAYQDSITVDIMIDHAKLNKRETDFCRAFASDTKLTMSEFARDNSISRVRAYEIKNSVKSKIMGVL